MNRSSVAAIPLLMLCLLAACGGGGGDGGGSSTVTTPVREAAQAYAGRWATACEVTTPAGTDLSYPDGISTDEVLTVTRIDASHLSVSSVTSAYNNTSCSTATSYFVGSPVLVNAEIVGSRTEAAGEVDLAVLVAVVGGGSVKALLQVQGGALHLTRADGAGVVLDAGGYPASLNLSRPFARLPD